MLIFILVLSSKCILINFRCNTDSLFIFYIFFSDLNRNTNNSSTVQPVTEKHLDLSLNAAATVRENNQMLNSSVVVNTEGKLSSDSNGNSLDVQEVNEQFKSLSFLETKDDNIRTKDETKIEEDMQVDETAESTDGKTNKVLHFLNKELVKEEKEQSEVKDLRQTSLDVDHHDAKPCSEQPENVVHSHVPSPSESVLTPSHETNESHKPNRAETKLGDSTKGQEDEKSSDIWTSPNQIQMSGVSSTGVNLADKKITKVEKDSEESQEQIESDSEQGTENNETDDREKEESDTDPDSSSEESAQDENKSEAGGPGPKKRRKQRKKGKEKYFKKQERKEKNKTIKESSETAVGDSNSSSKKKKPGIGNESSSTSATTTKYHSVMNVSYSLPPSSSEYSLASGSEQQISIGGHIQFQQPREEGPESGSSVDPKSNQENQADAKVINL